MYEIAEGKTETFSNLELLQAAAQHIGSKNISAFYKIREGVFIVVLLNSELKETYAQETNFQKKIRDRGIKVTLEYFIINQRYQEVVTEITTLMMTTLYIRNNVAANIDFRCGC